jgi:hypothetical protein
LLTIRAAEKPIAITRKDLRRSDRTLKSRSESGRLSLRVSV